MAARPPPIATTAAGSKGSGAMATVAPWATSSRPLATTASPPSSSFNNDSGSGGGGGSGSSSSSSSSSKRGKDDKDSSSGVGIRRIMAYMGECQPSAEDIEDGQRRWVAAQSAPAPTLLPDLKFHDLVFGQELGSGSFSTVKYARQILKQQASGSSTRLKGRSVWPEFAVKVISSSKIAEFGYEQNVIREIAILKTLSHPVSHQWPSARQSVSRVARGGNE